MLKIKNFKKAEEFRFLQIDDISDYEAAEFSMFYKCPVAYFN